MKKKFILLLSLTLNKEHFIVFWTHSYPVSIIIKPVIYQINLKNVIIFQLLELKTRSLYAVLTLILANTRL